MLAKQALPDEAWSLSHNVTTYIGRKASKLAERVFQLGIELSSMPAACTAFLGSLATSESWLASVPAGAKQRINTSLHCLASNTEQSSCSIGVPLNVARCVIALRCVGFRQGVSIIFNMLLHVTFQH